MRVLKISFLTFGVAALISGISIGLQHQGWYAHGSRRPTADQPIGPIRVREHRSSADVYIGETDRLIYRASWTVFTVTGVGATAFGYALNREKRKVGVQCAT